MENVRLRNMVGIALVVFTCPPVANTRADEPVRMYGRAETMAEASRLKGHDGEVLDALTMPDGTLLTAGADGTLRLWDVPGGQQLRLVANEEQPITKLMLAPSSREVLSFSATGEITVWTLPTPMRGWGPEQIVGPPNSDAGDQSTAWASGTQDDQQEWLLLEYETSVTPTAVQIYENDNPGAVTEVIAIDDDAREVTLWRWGEDTPLPPSDGLKLSLPVKIPFQVNRIKITLDSVSVPGWNEIDAVGLVDEEGDVQWAVAAAASSTYAERGNERLVRELGEVPPIFNVPENATLLSHVDHEADARKAVNCSEAAGAETEAT
jgi:hypothetical protein